MLYMLPAAKNPQCRELIDAFNKGLNIIRTEGIFDKILENYGVK